MDSCWLNCWIGPARPNEEQNSQFGESYISLELTKTWPVFFFPELSNPGQSGNSRSFDDWYRKESFSSFYFPANTILWPEKLHWIEFFSCIHNKSIFSYIWSDNSKAKANNQIFDYWT